MKRVFFISILVAINFNIAWGKCNAHIEVVGNPSFCNGTVATLEVVGISGTLLDWYRNGELIADNTGFTINITKSGTYTASSNGYFTCGYNLYTMGNFGPIEIVFSKQLPDISLVYLEDKVHSEHQLTLTSTYTHFNWEGDFTIEWFFNGPAIPNSNGITIMSKGIGTYYTTITDTMNCATKSADQLTVEEQLIVEEQERIYEQLTIYPNPSSGVFTVAGATGEIQVVDLLGNLVLRTNKKEIDMGSYPAGIYMVKAGEAVRKLILR